MRYAVTLSMISLFLFLFLVGTPAAGPAGAASCQFVLGFQALRDAIPERVGDCITDEQFNPVAGRSSQQTTGADGRGGLLVWRKIDNATAFTDGYRTWLLGPEGLQRRLNSERFSWERDRLTLDQLRNMEYRLPLSLNPKDQPAPILLSDGVYENRASRVRVQLVVTINPVTYGDLDGDGQEDAVVLLAFSGGGSGTFTYAIPVINNNGTPVSGVGKFLGDRIALHGVTLDGAKVSVDITTQGPGEPMCCGTLRTTVAFIVPR